MKNEVSHEGHRQRLKARFLNDSLEGFEPHNILELLLFYSIPRQDTNEIAHALINRFGSLKNVFDADFNELITVPGIKENSATLIKLIPQISKAYLLDNPEDDLIYDHADKIGKFLVNKYIGETTETVYMLLLDNSFKLIDCVRLQEGSVSSAQLAPRRIMDFVIKKGASMVVLAHNHPNGMPVPSSEDIETTITLSGALEMFDVGLIEHFLIAGNRYVPLMHDVAHIRCSLDIPQLIY